MTCVSILYSDERYKKTVEPAQKDYQCLAGGGVHCGICLVYDLLLCCDNDVLVRIFVYTNSTYYVRHTTHWTELNVLLYGGTCVLNGLLLCVWLRLTTLNKRI